MKIVFLGATKFSESILDALLKEEHEIVAIFTIPRDFKISYSEKLIHNSNYADLNAFAKQHDISCTTLDTISRETLQNHADAIKALKPDVILAMGWYHTVPKSIREHSTYGAWGIHASLLPAYAGHAPLVWAMIEGQQETGVTLFRFTSVIDGGDVIAQNKIKIMHEDTIASVYERATTASIELICETLRAPENIVFKEQDPSLMQKYPPRTPEDGEINLNDTAENIYNFIRAQSAPYPGAFIKTKDNKKIIIQNAEFAKNENKSDNEKYHFEDFTLANLKSHLFAAKAHYDFITYDNTESSKPWILLRHDIDYSPQRALKLAKIEHELDIQATYFIQLNSKYYNSFEDDVVSHFKEIISWGHKIGLHVSISEERDLESQLQFEKNTLEHLLNTKIDVFSWHNPTQSQLSNHKDKQYAGMMNSYQAAPQATYISDSNGYWRHDRLFEILNVEKHPQLHVLLHPIWWQDTVMSPRQRIMRALNGRRIANQNDYEQLLKASNRKNIS